MDGLYLSSVYAEDSEVSLTALILDSFPPHSRFLQLAPINRLRQRVEFSTRAVGKLLQAFDRIIQRNERLGAAIQAAATSTGGSGAGGTGEDGEPMEEDSAKKEGEDDEEGKKEGGEDKGEEGEEKTSTSAGGGSGGAAATALKFNINEEVKKLNFDMQMETSRLQVSGRWCLS